jgi:hypothetical protein
MWGGGNGGGRAASQQYYLKLDGKMRRLGFCIVSGTQQASARNDSGQAHFTVKMPVRKEGGKSARLLILYGVPVVNI